jgi:hypothetical protein
MLIVVTTVAILAVATVGVVQNQAEVARRIATDDAVFKSRQAISLFREQTGRLPNLLSGWTPLTTRFTLDGKTIGPMLNQTPTNALAPEGIGPSCVLGGNDAVLYLNDCVFMYDYAGGNGSGRFIAAYDYRNAPVPNDAVPTADARAAMNAVGTQEPVLPTPVAKANQQGNASKNNNHNANKAN